MGGSKAVGRLIATSAAQDLLPRIEAAVNALGSCHNPTSPSRTCVGCQVSVESIYQSVLRSWEWFVVEVLLDLMMGYRTGHPNSIRSASSGAYNNRRDAESSLLRTRYDGVANIVTLKRNPGRYLLLHNPRMVITVAEYWVPPQNPLADEYRSSQTDISDVLTLRHGLSHGTAHSQQETRNLFLRIDPGNVYASIGEFLLSRPTMASDTWLEHFVNLLYGAATRISP